MGREMAREKKQREDQEAARVALEAARVARERKQREDQEAADRMFSERKRRREEQEMVEAQARKLLDIAEKIESPKQCKEEKLYYHCVFNGINNTCFMAPLGEGVNTSVPCSNRYVQVCPVLSRWQLVACILKLWSMSY